MINEKIEDLQNGYFIIQNPSLFCFGVDAVLLSDFVKAKEGDKVLDLGCGNGIIPLLLYAKTPLNITGVEIQKESVDLARRSIKLNKLDDKIRIINGDIKQIKDFLKGKKFDIVVSNPPYINFGGGILNESKSLAIARHEVLCTLSDIANAAAYTLNHLGVLYLIHRPHRIVDIITTLRQYKLEPKVIRYVHPYVDKEATMVLISATKGGREMCKVLPPVLMYN